MFCSCVPRGIKRRSCTSSIQTRPQHLSRLFESISRRTTKPQSSESAPARSCATSRIESNRILSFYPATSFLRRRSHFHAYWINSEQNPHTMALLRQRASSRHENRTRTRQLRSGVCSRLRCPSYGTNRQGRYCILTLQTMSTKTPTRLSSARVYYRGAHIVCSFDFELNIVWGSYPRTRFSGNLQDAHVYVCRRAVLDLLQEKIHLDSLREEFFPWLCKLQYSHSKRAKYEHCTHRFLNFARSRDE